ncbi:predicted protein [Sclerotinia sclerotiorum 1980 UF-70]|uniref:Uncharacterized protein n=1 Tax=Sclerotinia sclerotiorum (strain ATCC 18683 / 1980 / Ss-1) TaxID=665079 RepID=A7EQR1_SCLS1|nr:predicted protein [Sclerotinia sclerotiorum 1980 UF-70]EDN91803.1 predicted protein [Sclerotinia sclerotiorum 1980 UF-70]
MSKRTGAGIGIETTLKKVEVTIDKRLRLSGSRMEMEMGKIKNSNATRTPIISIYGTVHVQSDTSKVLVRY